MAHGFPDYTAFEVPVTVPSGGTGAGAWTLNGVLYGRGTNTLGVTAAGAPDEVLRVPGAGGAPAFGALDLSTASFTGILPITNGGTGTATPSLVAGTGISISGTWPNQTVTNTSPASALGDPVTVAHGGTGTATPSLVAGTGISISGTWPNQTVTNTSPASALGDPVTVVHGGTGQNNLDPLNVTTLKASPGAAEVGEIIQLAASPTADALQVKNSAAGLVFRVEAVGEVHAFSQQVDAVPFVANLFAGQTADAMQVQDSGANPLFEITAGGSLIIEPIDPVWIALVVKGAALPTHDLMQLKDNANNILVEVQKQGSVVLAPVNTLAIPLTCVMPAGASTSAIAVEDSALTVLFNVSAKGATLINPTDTVTIPLTLKMPALATARAFEVQNSAAAVLMQVGPDGETVINPTSTTSIPLVLKFPAANTVMALQVQNSASAVLAGFGADGQLTLNPAAAATIPLVITCPALPTANALQVKSNAGAVLMYVGNDGSISAASCSLTSPLPVASGGTGSAGGFGDGARVHNSADETIPNSSLIALTFDCERYDNGGLHDTVTNSSRLTAQKAGKYFISGHIAWNQNFTGIRALDIRLGGVTLIAAESKNVRSDGWAEHSVSTVYHLAVGDYVELTAYQTSGGPLNVLAFIASSPEFAMQWLGP